MATFGIEIIEVREKSDRYEIDFKIFDKAITDDTKTDIHTGTVTLIPKPALADLKATAKVEILSRLKTLISTKATKPSPSTYNYDSTTETLTDAA